MIIGLGSQNKAKIKACENAFKKLQSKFRQKNEAIHIIPLRTETSVADMPLTQAEMRKGALERALFVYERFSAQKQDFDYTLGLEGGVYRNMPQAESYLQNWVYAFDGQGGHYGSSASLPLPGIITEALFDERRELAEVVDEISGLSDVRSRNGAFGILSNNLITRSASFETAVICALTPFFNKKFYSKGSK